MVIEHRDHVDDRRDAFPDVDVYKERSWQNDEGWKGRKIKVEEKDGVDWMVDLDPPVHGVDGDGKDRQRKHFRQQNQETLGGCPEHQVAFVGRYS